MGGQTTTTTTTTTAAKTETFSAVFFIPTDAERSGLAVTGTIEEPTPGFMISLVKLKHQPNSTILHLTLIEVQPKEVEPQHVVEQSVAYFLPEKGNNYKKVAIYRHGKLLATATVTNLISETR